MTTKQTMTHRQATALAAFIHELRGDWPAHEIEHFLGSARDRGSVHDVAIAAIKASAKASYRSPAAIPGNGDHWREGKSTKGDYRQPTKAETCEICYQSRDVCEARWFGDHKFTPLTQAARKDARNEGLTAFQEARKARAGSGGQAAAAHASEEPQPRPCPECVQGKHPNCTGQVLNDADDLEPCPCQEAGHRAGTLPPRPPSPDAPEEPGRRPEQPPLPPRPDAPNEAPDRPGRDDRPDRRPARPARPEPQKPEAYVPTRNAFGEAR